MAAGVHRHSELWDVHMHTSTTTLEVLCLTAEEADGSALTEQLSLDDEIATSVASSVEAAIAAAESADCLLCADGHPPITRDGHIRRIRRDRPDVPIVVFAGDTDDDRVRTLLRAGASDIIPSSPATTPPTLLRSRITKAVDTTHTASLSQFKTEQNLFAQGPAVVFRWQNESQWPVDYVSENSTDMLGYTPEQLQSGQVTYAELIHEADVDRVTEEVAHNSDETTEWFSHDPYRLRTDDGEVIWVKDTTKIIREQGEITHYLGYLVDITERKQREQQIATQRDELARLNRINEIIRGIDRALVGAATRAEIEQAVCNHLTASGRYGFALALERHADEAFVPRAWTDASVEFVESAFPADASDTDVCPGLRALRSGEVEVVRSVREMGDTEWQTKLLEEGIESLAAIPVTYQNTEYGVIAVYAERGTTFTQREVDVLGELGDTVGYAIAAVERREREQILTALYEATQDLLGAETEADVCRVVVETATDVLGLSGIGIFLFDDDANVLRPMAATDDLHEFYGGETEFGPGKRDSVVWQSYVSGEQQFFKDVQNATALSYPDTDARSTLMIPLGEHGVFVTVAGDFGVFDDRMRQLVGLLATTTEAALDRVAGRMDIRERDEKLRARTDRLDRVEGVLDCLRDVNRLLVNAGTRTEIETGVCERLTQMEPYDFAWIGTVPPDSESVEPQTWAGRENGYLDAVSLTVGDCEPVATTGQTGQPTIVTDVTDRIQAAEWVQPAINRNFQSVAAVPLLYDETTYGVLGVYASEPDAFQEPAEGVLRELGHVIADSINSVETTRGVLSERLTELELRIGSPGTFLNAVARVTEESVSYREILPEEGETTRVLFSLSDPPIDDILSLETEFVAVEALTHVAADGEDIFRATVGGQTVAATLLTCGGLPRTVVADADASRAVVRIPQELSVRAYLERVRENYPETELLSRCGVTRESQQPDIQKALDAKLTDRQREVLLTAYRCGFFESPRETTGAELAALLNISQPTLTHHLREAQRRLFEVLYDGTDSDF